MATAQPKPEVIVIVGPTASGKSDLALKIAEEFDGEVIAADSRTVYQGMDIGTAKPTAEDQYRVIHHGLDLAKPGQRFTAHQFKTYAEDAIADIQKAGKLPILVGGTGLYVDAVVYDFGFRADADLKQRQELEAKTAEELQQIIQQKGYPIPENHQNRRHLIRTIETQGKRGRKSPKPRPGTLILGLMPKDEVLRQRINQRAEKMFKSGVIDETQALIKKYGEEALVSRGGIIYKICIQLLKQEISLEVAKELFKTADWQYARRQRTWFKRNKFITWFDSADQAHQYLSTILNN